ncbi:MAG: hypothetical protein ACREVO_00735 [Steroidobacteraceae bacterium]
MAGEQYRKMVVISDVISLEQQRQFVAWLNSVGMGWSHWLSGGWLVNAVGNQPGVDAVRDNFLRIAPNTQVVVLQVDVSNWAGWLFNPTTQAAKTWLEDQWGLQSYIGPQTPMLPNPKQR